MIASDSESPAAAGPRARRAGFRPVDLPIVRKLLIAQYLVGALAALLGVIAPDPDPSDHTALLGFAAFGVLGGLALVALPASPRVLWIANFGGILSVSVCCVIAVPISGTSFFYLWPVLTIAYYMTRAHLVLAYALMLPTFALAIYVSPDEIPASLFTCTVLTVCVIGVFVSRMRERLDDIIDQLRRSAATDGLTGLLNRGAFTAAFQREIARARRAEVPLTLVLFDLDHFKKINDTYGHAGGDEALVRFAATLRAEHRGSDLVARIGGEEFAAVLYNADDSEGLRFAQRIADRLSGPAAGATEDMTFSAGVASLRERVVDDAEALLKRADDALYEAKERGRRRTVVARDLEAAA